MLKRFVVSPFIRVLFLVFIVAQLSACGGGSGTDAASATATTSNVADVTDDVVLAGSVGDGPVTGATIEIWNAKGRRIGTMMSDNTASFKTRIRVRRSNYPLLLKVRGGTDLVTGSKPDFQMVSVKLDRYTRQVNINPFSTLIVSIAQTLPGGINADNINTAKTMVVDKLGFGLDPRVIGDPINAPITDNNIANLVKASEAMGEMVRRTRDLVSATGRKINGNAVLTAIAADMRDGTLNGRGAAGANPLISAVAKVVSGQVLVEALANTLKVDGVVATSVIDKSIETTRPGISSDNLTRRVRITDGMLKETQAALAAARVLDSSIEVTALGAIVSKISAGAMPKDIANVLPADSSRSLDNAVLLSSTADETQLAAVNAQDEQTGSDDQTPAAPVPTKPVTTPPVTTDPVTTNVSSRRTWSRRTSPRTPVTTDPVTTEPVTTEPVSTEPVTTKPATTNPVTTNPVTTAPVNLAPVINGSPARSVVAGTAYSFQPVASDADGDTLTFSITGKPAWAGFNKATGRLSGTPGDADVRTYRNIVIAVSDGTNTTTLQAFSIAVTAAPVVNNPPGISGTPARSVVAGTAYSFQPVASDADGDTLTFSITGKPTWASFNTSTGRLTGTPGDGDTGTSSSIVIKVTDGTDTASLQAFTIRVDPAQKQTGSFSLSWTAPVARADGTPLSLADIGGYRIYYGTSSGNYPDTVDVSDGSAQSATVNNLPVGTYRAVMTTYDSNGLESARSAEVVKVAR